MMHSVTQRQDVYVEALDDCDKVKKKKKKKSRLKHKQAFSTSAVITDNSYVPLWRVHVVYFSTFQKADVLAHRYLARKKDPSLLAWKMTRLVVLIHINGTIQSELRTEGYLQVYVARKTLLLAERIRTPNILNSLCEAFLAFSPPPPPHES